MGRTLQKPGVKDMWRQFLIWVLVFVVSPVVLARDYTPEECPVVGNTETEIYHVLGDLGS